MPRILRTRAKWYFEVYRNDVLIATVLTFNAVIDSMFDDRKKIKRGLSEYSYKQIFVA